MANTQGVVYTKQSGDRTATRTVVTETQRVAAVFDGFTPEKKPTGGDKPSAQTRSGARGAGGSENAAGNAGS